MYIYHITNLTSALNIIKSKQFIPFSRNIYNGDSCLNCFCSIKQGYNYGQEFQNQGVVLVFKWSGKVQQISMNESTPFKNNILYNQKPWRCFIPTNTKGKNLKIVKIYFDKYYLNDKFDLPMWTKFLPKKYLKQYVRKLKLEFILNLRQEIKKDNSYIEIL